jgi:prepilin-type N-terminal cleavage/methylation domain-containing protein/prepilin-type processing-associated H-X9-DG protein
MSLAFTLVELLVVVAIIAVLAAMLLPAIAKTKTKAQGIQCLNNVRLLTLSWFLYADDQDGKLCPNRVGSSDSWVRGVLDFDNTNPDNTNTLYLVDARYAKIGPYAQTGASFKCPADRSTISHSGRNYPRVRSVAMNFAVGAAEQPGQLGFAIGWTVYKRSAEIVNPANLWVLMDEHPDSIDDGRFIVDCEHRQDKAQFISVPANYHNGAATVSFADGHSEIHKWLDPGTKVENKYCGCIAHYSENGFYTVVPRSPDVAWLQERTSSKLK